MHRDYYNSWPMGSVTSITAGDCRPRLNACKYLQSSRIGMCNSQCFHDTTTCIGINYRLMGSVQMSVLSGHNWMNVNNYKPTGMIQTQFS
jgi:hypothetical protein